MANYIITQIRGSDNIVYTLKDKEATDNINNINTEINNLNEKLNNKQNNLNENDFITLFGNKIYGENKSNIETVNVINGGTGKSSKNEALVNLVQYTSDNNINEIIDNNSENNKYENISLVVLNNDTSKTTNNNRLFKWLKLNKVWNWISDLIKNKLKLYSDNDTIKLDGISTYTEYDSSELNNDIKLKINEKFENKNNAEQKYIKYEEHINKTDNPHNVTREQLGLEGLIEHYGTCEDIMNYNKDIDKGQYITALSVKNKFDNIDNILENTQSLLIDDDTNENKNFAKINNKSLFSSNNFELIESSLKGVPKGIAELDENGIVMNNQLPYDISFFKGIINLDENFNNTIKEFQNNSWFIVGNISENFDNVNNYKTNDRIIKINDRNYYRIHSGEDNIIENINNIIPVNKNITITANDIDTSFTNNDNNLNIQEKLNDLDDRVIQTEKYHNYNNLINIPLFINDNNEVTPNDNYKNYFQNLGLSKINNVLVGEYNENDKGRTITLTGDDIKIKDIELNSDDEDKDNLNNSEKNKLSNVYTRNYINDNFVNKNNICNISGLSLIKDNSTITLNDILNAEEEFEKDDKFIAMKQENLNLLFNTISNDTLGGTTNIKFLISNSSINNSVFNNPVYLNYNTLVNNITSSIKSSINIIENTDNSTNQQYPFLMKLTMSENAEKDSKNRNIVDTYSIKQDTIKNIEINNSEDSNNGLLKLLYANNTYKYIDLKTDLQLNKVENKSVSEIINSITKNDLKSKLSVDLINSVYTNNTFSIDYNGILPKYELNKYFVSTNNGLRYIDNIDTIKNKQYYKGEIYKTNDDNLLLFTENSIQNEDNKYINTNNYIHLANVNNTIKSINGKVGDNNNEIILTASDIKIDNEEENILSELSNKNSLITINNPTINLSDTNPYLLFWNDLDSNNKSINPSNLNRVSYSTILRDIQGLNNVGSFDNTIYTGQSTNYSNILCIYKGSNDASKDEVVDNLKNKYITFICPTRIEFKNKQNILTFEDCDIINLKINMKSQIIFKNCRLKDCDFIINFNISNIIFENCKLDNCNINVIDNSIDKSISIFKNCKKINYCEIESNTNNLFNNCEFITNNEINYIETTDNIFNNCKLIMNNKLIVQNDSITIYNNINETNLIISN